MQIVWVFSWQKGSGKKAGKGQEKRGNGDSRARWTREKTEHTAAWCPQGGNQNLCAIEEDERETIEETRDNDEELQALCLLEGSNNEQ